MLCLSSSTCNNNSHQPLESGIDWRLYATRIPCKEVTMTRPRQLLALCGAGICLLIGGLTPIMSPAQSSVPQQTHVYNPYPPGILPADLDSEIARVLREVDVIEGRAIERWHSLPAPTQLGMRPGPNPPVLKDTG